MEDNFQRRAVTIGLLLATVGVASVAYYFIIALPRHNAAKLKFEQDKYASEKSARELRELDEALERERRKGEEEVMKTQLSNCLLRANMNAEKYVLLNGGHETDKGTVEASRYIWDEAEKKKKAEQEDCYRLYR